MRVGDVVRRRGEYGTVRHFVEPKPGWRRALVSWPLDDSRAGELDGWYGSEQHVDVDQLEVVPVRVVERDQAAGYNLVTAAPTFWGVVDTDGGKVHWHGNETEARAEYERHIAADRELDAPTEPPRQLTLGVDAGLPR